MNAFLFMRGVEFVITSFTGFANSLNFAKQLPNVINLEFSVRNTNKQWATSVFGILLVAFILYAFLFCPTSEMIPTNSFEWENKEGRCIYLARFKRNVLLEGQKTRASMLSVFLSHWQLSHTGCWITAVHTLVRTSAPLIPSWGCANVCEGKASSEQSRADPDFCRALHAKLSLELTSLVDYLTSP